MEKLRFKGREPDAEIYEMYNDLYQLRVPEGRKMKIYSFKTFEEAYKEYNNIRRVE